MLTLWEGVAAGESDRDKGECMCLCVRGYSSLPRGSHAKIKHFFTQVEVAFWRKSCVFGKKGLESFPFVNMFAYMRMWLYCIFNPLFLVPIVVDLLRASHMQKMECRCVGVRTSVDVVSC